MGKFRDLTGQKFFRLTVIRRDEPQPSDRNVFWLCKCECTKITRAAGANLVNGQKLSCGCYQAESAAKMLKVNRLAKPGLHGLSQTDEYNIWSRMKARCGNQTDHKFPIYGARGIKVCDRWLHSFEAFYADMGPRPTKKHTIDRINNDGNYEPGNCRWVTNFQQSRNRSTNVNITINGVTRCVVDWATVLNVTRSHFHEMCRKTYSNGRGLRPDPFPSVEAAILHVYRHKIGPIA